MSWPCATRARAVSWPGLPAVLRHSCLPQAPTGHNTPYCIAIQFMQPNSFWSQYRLCIAIQCPQPSSLPQSQYTNCIVIQFLTTSSPITIHLVYCNTFPLAKQALPTCNTPWCIAIHFLSLQAFSCNTILCQKD